uniref:Serine and arginine rich splicing factor 2 n=1 Tax=Gorilla gorilla gorilla TaxID=9595 RepID=G3REN4_GORGO
MSYGRPPPDVEGMTSLKVDNLTYRTSPDTLRRVFEKYGRVGDVYIPRDRYTKESRGFAFVRFHDKRDAEDAMDAMDGAVLDADPGVGAVPGLAADLATAARSLGPALVLDLGRPPSPDPREGPSPSPRRSPDLVRGPGPGLGPGVLPQCPRGNPNPGRDRRVPPSLLKRKERCPLKKMLRSPV